MNWNSESIKAFDKEPVIPKKPYVGHTKFKSPDIVFEYTTEEIEIINKCRTDINLFLQYCKVELSYDDNVLLNEMFSNRHMKYEKRINQSIIAVLATHYLCFETDKTLLLVHKKIDILQDIITNIKKILQQLPFFMTPGITYYTSSKIYTDSNCRIMIQSLKSQFAIGFNINYLIFYDKNNNQSDILHNLLPAIASTKDSKSLLIIEK